MPEAAPPGYFDYNATAPLSPAAREAWLETAERMWHNPSSLYREAGYAKMRLEDLREDLADHLGCDNPERIIFTGGATEANNAVIRWFANRQSRVAVSSIEHPCVSVPAKKWIDSEHLTALFVNSQTGAVEVETVRQAISRDGATAVSVMAANNETGALQPWREIAALCKESGASYHCDAAQWIGKLPATDLAVCDFATGSAHKFGGPKGVGFLLVPEDLDDFTVLDGGPQEGEQRAGTENLPGIAAMLAALEEKPDDWLAENSDTWAAARNEFEKEIEEKLGARILLRGEDRLWNTTMFILPHTKNLKWLTRLSQAGFSLSTGSACSAGQNNPSAVMEAMGLDYEEMGRVIRVSGGWDTQPDHWRDLADAFVEVEKNL